MVGQIENSDHPKNEQKEPLYLYSYPWKLLVFSKDATPPLPLFFLR